MCKRHSSKCIIYTNSFSLPHNSTMLVPLLFPAKRGWNQGRERLRDSPKAPPLQSGRGRTRRCSSGVCALSCRGKEALMGHGEESVAALLVLMDCAEEGGPAGRGYWFYFWGFLAVWRSMQNFPDQGLNLCPLHWKCRVLTAGPPGKSRKRILRQAFPKQNASQASFVPFRNLYQASPACHALSQAAGALAVSTSGGNPCPCWAEIPNLPMLLLFQL